MTKLSITLPDLPPGYEITTSERPVERDDIGPFDVYRIRIRGAWCDDIDDFPTYDAAARKAWSMWLEREADDAWRTFVRPLLDARAPKPKKKPLRWRRGNIHDGPAVMQVLQRDGVVVARVRKRHESLYIWESTTHKGLGKATNMQDAMRSAVDWVQTVERVQ